MKECSRCLNPARPGQRYCGDCHNTYMRAWRERTVPSPEQRFKDNCRSYANVYKRRGKIAIKSCEICDNPAEMHHDDYSRTLQVRWLCRRHHMEFHGISM